MPSFAHLTEVEQTLAAFLPARLSRPAYTTEYVKRFLAQIGDPQNTAPAIHVAGTSGKTSTAYYLAALLQQAGYKVGLLTSPHIEQINERVQINMTPLDEPTFCADMSVFLGLAEASGVTLSHAELLYGFAFWEFARHHVDYMVVEVGLGGTHDATNVITRADKICVITDIGLDHTATLGGSLGEITAHKAGIIQAKNTVFCYNQEPEVMQTVRNISNHKRSALFVLKSPSGTLPVSDFLPLFQRRNFALAYAAAKYALRRQGQALTPGQLLQAAQIHIPGRMETLFFNGRTITLDGAHNVQKMHRLSEAWQQTYSRDDTAVLVAFAQNRSRALIPMIIELAGMASRVIATSLPDDGVHKGRLPSEIAAACKKVGISQVGVVKNADDALQTLCKSKEQHLLVTGSFYLLRHLRPRLRTTKGDQKL